MKAPLAILGCGNWGTTLAIKLAHQGYPVRVWETNEERAHRVQQDRVNEDFLPGVELPDSLAVSSDAAYVVAECPIVVVALPTPVIRTAIGLIASHVMPSVVMLSASKGLEFETGLRITQIITEILADKPHQVAALSGPNLAWEIARDHPSSAVIASSSAEVAKALQATFASPTYRIYTSSDLIGVELGGALKNVIAIAAGIVNGLGFGDNTKAALMTRGLAEITRFGVHQGAHPLTFQGLSGLGDLVATCASTLSRNHQAGRLVAKGATVNEICTTMKMVAEGINTTKALHPRAVATGVRMPITAALHRVLFEGVDVRLAIEGLMTRDLKSEDEFASLAPPSAD